MGMGGEGSARWLLDKAGKKEMERGGGSGRPHGKNKGGGPTRTGGYGGVMVAGNSRKRRRQAVNMGMQWGSSRGEKRRACGLAWKRKKHGPSPKE
jgi:hypothetical protein